MKYTMEFPCEPGTEVYYLDKTHLKVVHCHVSLVSMKWPKGGKPLVFIRASGITENFIGECTPGNVNTILFFTQAEADAALVTLQKELQGKHCNTCASLGAHYNRLVKDQILCHRCTLHSKVLDNPASEVCGYYAAKRE